MTRTTPSKIDYLVMGAARIRAEAEADNGNRPSAHAFNKADELEGRVRAALPERYDEKGAGGELVPHGRDGVPAADYRSTLQKPDYVAAAASRDRLDLANDAGVLELAVDTADTIDAANSLEKMLAHQLAALHKSAMQICGQLNNQINRMNRTRGHEQTLASSEVVKLTNSTARLMQTIQNGLTTLQRLRSGGHQTVTVQHVNVGAGGQAVVAGAVGGGGGISPTTGGNGEK